MRLTCGWWVARDPGWNGRGHFFAAAAEAMRRILIERARRMQALRRGGDRNRLDLDRAELAAPERSEDLLALDEALEQLAIKDARKAELVKLRYFAGLTMEQAAETLGISLRHGPPRLELRPGLVAPVDHGNPHVPQKTVRGFRLV